MTSTNNVTRVLRLFCVLVALIGLLVALFGAGAVATESTAPEQTAPESTAVESSPAEEQAATEPVAASGRPPVVVIMTGGLRWDTFDPSQTPAIASLAASGIMANMVPVISRGASCPLDSWLALSAGRQTAPVALSRPWMCGQQWVRPDRQLARWGEYQTTISASQSAARLGTVAQILADSGVTSEPIGPGAAHVLANSDGMVPGNYLLAPRSDEALAERVAQAAGEYDVTFVDAYPVDYSAIWRWIVSRLGLQSPEREKQESDAAAGLNAARVEAIVSALPAGTRVLITSLTDVDSVRSMQVVIAADVSNGAVAGSHLLPSIGYSDSVRQRGVVQLSDLMPTLFSWLGIEDTSGVSGTPMVAHDEQAQTCTVDDECFSSRLHDLSDRATHASAMRTTRGAFIPYLTRAAVGYFLLSIVLLARRPYQFLASHPRLRTLWMWLGVTVASVPVSSLVVNAFPWWNSSFAKLALIGGSWLIAAGLAGVAMAARRWHVAAPLLIVSGLTALLFLADAATGAHLMADSPVGFNLLNAARFYGVGNEAFALLATGTLTVLAFLGVWLRDRPSGRLRGRWPAVITVSALGLWVAAIDALPSMGADFGGVLSFIPALLVLVLAVGRLRMSFARAAIIGVVTMAVATTIAMLDWMRAPTARSHLGRFVQSIVDGDVSEVIGRKLGTNLRLLMASTHRWVVLAALLLIAVALINGLRSRRQPAGDRWWRRRPYVLVTGQWDWMAPDDGEHRTGLLERLPALKATLMATGTCMVLAFALNDSGIVLPGMAAIIFVPLLQTVIVTDQELREAQPVTVQ